MAGTWTTQDKVRPGAYIRFTAQHQSQLSTGTRGICVVPMQLSWGPVGAAITVTSDDLVRGNTVNLIGLRSTDAAIKRLAEALLNCPTALVVRLGTGGEAASVSLGNSITATADYPGTFGNSIMVTVLENELDGGYVIVTTARGTEVDRQNVQVVEEFVPNGYITITGTTSYNFTAESSLPTGVTSPAITGIEVVGDVTLQHTESGSNHTLAVAVAGTTVAQQSWATAAWTGSVSFSNNGVTLTFDTTQAASFNTAQKIGTIAAVGLSALAGVPLAGGEDPEVDDMTTAYQSMMNLIRSLTWQCLACPDTVTEPSMCSLITQYIRNLREDDGKKVQAVVYNYPTADYEGIISMTQGYKIGTEEYPVAEAICWFAGATAGAALNESNTYKVITGATEIIDPMDNGATIQALRNGQIVLTKLQSGNVVVEKDINTLHTFTEDRTYDYSKNRVIRCLDDIATQVSATFENTYIGKVDNNEDGRTTFKGDLIGYARQLEGQNAIQNFDSATDIEVYQGQSIDAVVVNMWIQPVDAMEKLYMTVTVGSADSATT